MNDSAQGHCFMGLSAFIPLSALSVFYFIIPRVQPPVPHFLEFAAQVPEGESPAGITTDVVSKALLEGGIVPSMMEEVGVAAAAAGVASEEPNVIAITNVTTATDWAVAEDDAALGQVAAPTEVAPEPATAAQQAAKEEGAGGAAKPQEAVGAKAE